MLKLMILRSQKPAMIRPPTFPPISLVTYMKVGWIYSRILSNSLIGSVFLCFPGDQHVVSVLRSAKNYLLQGLNRRSFKLSPRSPVVLKLKASLARIASPGDSHVLLVDLL